MSLFEKKTTLEIIEKKRKDYDNSLSEASVAVDAAMNQVEAAKALLESAADADDAVAFSDAKRQIADAATALEMAQMRKERLVSKGFISKEEADAAVTEYKTKMNQIDRDAANRVLELIAQIQTVCNAAKKDATSAFSEYCRLLTAIGRNLSGIEEISFNSGKISLTFAAVKSESFRLLEKPEQFGNAGMASLYRIAGRRQ